MREYLDLLPRPTQLKLNPGLPMVRPHSRSVSFMNVCMLQEQSLPYCLLSLHTTKILLPRKLSWIYLPPWMDCTLNNWVVWVLLSCWSRLMRSSKRCLAVRNKQWMLKNPQENKEILKFRQKWEQEESLPAMSTKYAILALPSHHSVWSSRSVMAPIFNLLPQTGGFDKKKGLWMNIGKYVKKKFFYNFT